MKVNNLIVVIRHIASFLCEIHVERFWLINNVNADFN